MISDRIKRSKICKIQWNISEKMGNPANLKSYQKGQSGNPGGRPRGSRNVSSVLATLLAEIAPDIVVDASFVRDISKGLKKATIADAAAARLVYEAVVNGQSWALREVLDRTEGRATQAIEISSAEKIESLADVVKRSIEQSRELHHKYGVPMSSDEEIAEIIREISEVNGVSEKELTSRIDLKTDDELHRFGENA